VKGEDRGGEEKGGGGGEEGVEGEGLRHGCWGGGVDAPAVKPNTPAR